MADVEGLGIANLVDIGLGSQDLPTFIVGVQETGVGLHTVTWPLECTIRGCYVQASTVCVSLDGTTVFAENVPTGSGGQIIAYLTSANIVVPLSFKMNSLQTMFIYNTSSTPVVFICSLT